MRHHTGHQQHEIVPDDLGERVHQRAPGEFQPPHPGGQEGPAPSVREQHPGAASTRDACANTRAQRERDKRPTTAGDGQREQTDRQATLPPPEVPSKRSESENPPGEEKQQCHLPRQSRRASLDVLEEKKTALDPVKPSKYGTAPESPFYPKTPQMGLARNPATAPEKVDAERNEKGAPVVRMDVNITVPNGSIEEQSMALMTVTVQRPVGSAVF
ncbi:hypothetical protein PAL_GLEAN10002352 [Pteropus alecto]|uniref:Uncharacterized protein n=1 Tax=Pteropus alecto TaxID=9402 RepID=L5KBU7_PTEAL|nr:hypothetical protein PAL_GLEAN10002352 [Pteropus alecto]